MVTIKEILKNIPGAEEIDVNTYYDKDFSRWVENYLVTFEKKNTLVFVCLIELNDYGKPYFIQVHYSRKQGETEKIHRYFVKTFVKLKKIVAYFTDLGFKQQIHKVAKDRYEWALKEY